ncbi:MAG: zinc ribbon domain-containing protein, partial [Candidatus Bathyarchaeota archaeon]|nr:zinc ribbon domain-containing protein [Candidatus Bathyarchaeota archaeon]
MNCPNCDKEIVDENAEVCPNCGEPLTPEEENEEELQVTDIQPKRGDTTVAVSVFTIIAAVIIASLGFIGIYQYPTLIDYYGPSYASNFTGFLIFGAIDTICGLVAIVGGIFMLKKRHLKFSLLGAVFVLAAVGSTYITMV